MEVRGSPGFSTRGSWGGGGGVGECRENGEGECSLLCF